LPSQSKEIYYKCPKCGYEHYDLPTLPYKRIPHKTKRDKSGKFVVLSYRAVPTCPICGCNMVRRRKK